MQRLPPQIVAGERFRPERRHDLVERHRCLPRAVAQRAELVSHDRAGSTGARSRRGCGEVRARIAAAAEAGRARSRCGDADRGRARRSPTTGSRRRWPQASACSARTTSRRRRAAGPRCGSAGPGVELHLIGGAADQQGGRGRGPVRRDPDARPAEARPRACQGDGAAGRGDRGCSCRSTPARSRRKSGVAPGELDGFVRDVPRRARAALGRADGDPARGRGRGAAHGPAGQARRAERLGSV